MIRSSKNAFTEQLGIAYETNLTSTNTSTWTSIRTIKLRFANSNDKNKTMQTIMIRNEKTQNPCRNLILGNSELAILDPQRASATYDHFAPIAKQNISNVNNPSVVIVKRTFQLTRLYTLGCQQLISGHKTYSQTNKHINKRKMALQSAYAFSST